jgi:hypothetical protein
MHPSRTVLHNRVSVWQIKVDPVWDFALGKKNQFSILVSIAVHLIASEIKKSFFRPYPKSGCDWKISKRICLVHTKHREI